MLARIASALLGNTASNVAGAVFSRVSLIALVTPAAIWFVAHKDDTFTVVTYAHLAAILLLVWIVGWVLVRIKPPGT